MLYITAAILAAIAGQATATGYGYGYGDDDDSLPPPPPALPSASCGAADSFESADPLSPWTLDLNDDTGVPPIAVFCTGDLGGAPADYGVGSGIGRDFTFTDAVDEAADGECALRVRAGCLAGSDYYFFDNTAATNAASRTFTATNAGCGAAAATGFTLSVAVTFDVKDPYDADYLYPYGLFTYLIDSDDRAAVTATVRGAEIPVAQVTSSSAIRQLERITVPVVERDYGIAEEFLVFAADLGDVAPGESLEVTVTVSATNDDDCSADNVSESSVIVIDDIRIEPRF